MTTEDLRFLAACLDRLDRHDTETLRALGGVFYTVAGEEWCDTARYSWLKEGPDLWVRQDDRHDVTGSTPAPIGVSAGSTPAGGPAV